MGLTAPANRNSEATTATRQPDLAKTHSKRETYPHGRDLRRAEPAVPVAADTVINAVDGSVRGWMEMYRRAWVHGLFGPNGRQVSSEFRLLERP